MPKIYFLEKDNKIYCFTEEELLERNIDYKSKLIEIKDPKQIDKCIYQNFNILDKNNNYIINDLIYRNIILRKDEIAENRSNTIDRQLLDFVDKYQKKDLIQIIKDDKQKTRISEKGYQLLYDFNNLVNGINPVTKQQLNWFDEYKQTPERLNTIFAIIIVAMQLFTDANHRTAHYLLEKAGLREDKIRNIINFISINREMLAGNVYRFVSNDANVDNQRSLSSFYENLPALLNIRNRDGKNLNDLLN